MMRLLTLLCICSLIHVGLSSTCIGFQNGRVQLQDYDPNYKICCGGVLRQRTTNVQCCNGNLYFSDKKVCCNGQISNKTVSRSTMKWEAECERNNSNCIDLMCCGKKLIPNEDNVFCCNETRIALTEDQAENKEFLSCCGESAYNSRSHFCCDELIILSRNNAGCCNNVIYNKKKHTCLRGKTVVKTKGLCGDKFYNKTTNTCCAGELNDVPQVIKDASGLFQDNPDAGCCGSSVIKSNETCCDERHFHGYPTHVIPKHVDFKCCGSGYYNQHTQFCADGNPVHRSVDLKQCGKYVINETLESCCVNKEPYNNKTHKCCKGAHYCVILKDEKCCNGLRMKNNEFCCENIKPCIKRDKDDDACCYDYSRDNGQTYSKKGNLTCKWGELSLPRKGELPCGKEHYNIDSQFCCSHKKYERSSGQCCNGVYSNIPQSEGRCCIDDNKAYRFDDPANPCIKQCNKEKTYDETIELCCGGKVYDYSGNNFCCGAHAIDPSKMGCCGDLFPYRLGGRKGCCLDTQLYDRKYSTCKTDGKIESIGDLKGLSDVEKVCHGLVVKSFDGGVQQACMRNNLISAKIKSIDLRQMSAGNGGNRFIRMELKGVKTMTDKIFPKDVIFNVHIGDGMCPLAHLKGLKRVMVFFDEELTTGKFVQISKDSHFFISPKTFRRYYSVKEAMSTHLCKLFS